MKSAQKKVEQKPRRGRPPTGAATKGSAVVVRVDPVLKAQIKARADGLSLTVSSYIEGTVKQDLKRAQAASGRAKAQA